MQRDVRISVGSGYTVSVGSGILLRCGELLRAAGIGGRLALVADSTVDKLYSEKTVCSLKDSGYSVDRFTFKAGESSKNLATLADLLEAFAGAGLGRDDCVVALGGGVTGDLAGFAAGCYMRGISLVQLPTTLLAAVDSSVGGKTAVDLTCGKNLAGLFLQPRAVLCDVDALSTLPASILADGAAEALKTAVLGDEDLFSLFESGEWRGSLDEVIIRSVEYKGRIVALDERESGLRKLLNLGHTPAHAIERLSGFSVPHGRAVAIGTAMMARAAAKLGKMSTGDALRVEKALRRMGLPVKTEFSPEDLARAALADKKRSGDSISVVIPRRIGFCEVESVPIIRLEKLFSIGMEALS